MAKTIMIQGTMSNAGKSLICAGLCRILRQDGYRVAPFKAQNMALNSYITADGLEMGRAQVVQAEAAGILPEAAMNPILLKPTNDTGSQVIVNGKVLGQMSARDYFAYKKRLIPEVEKAFRNLQKRFDIIVIEGAGSPAEINLKQDDLVNMGMAKMAKSPVLLVGDIDRGGVFAQLFGTWMLLEDEEKQLVKGLIINKFRGDKSILLPGVAMLEERCGLPVVGVAPYMQVELEDEDSLTERFSRQGRGGAVDIAVIRMPRISNFTDFLLLEHMDGAAVRYVDCVRDLRNPDMIILPGTKNTMADLLWMRQNGLEAAVLKEAARGTVIWGICGGYQMLGKVLKDDGHVEEGGRLKGMGLLPVSTDFVSQKRRTRVTGRFLEVTGILSGLQGLAFDGYEIHMGETVFEGTAMSELTDVTVGAPMSDHTDVTEGAVVSEHTDGTAGGWTAAGTPDGISRGNIYGTYVHGIFDREEVAGTVVQALAKRKGISVECGKTGDLHAFKEEQYDMLAAGLREHLDLEQIYEIIDRGI